MSYPFVLVTATCTVDEIHRRYPATGSIFSLLRLDNCCGAKLTLREAAARAGTDLGVLLSMLEAAACASLVGAGVD